MKLEALILLATVPLASPAPSQPSPQQDPTGLARTAVRTAGRLGDDVLATRESGAGPCRTVADLARDATVNTLRADFALAVASCINEESGTPLKFVTCLREAFGELVEGLELLAEQHEARLQLCTLTGGGIYDPDLDEDEFVDGVDHPYLPYLPGATWVYEARTDEGLEVVTVTVEDATREVDDIECIVVRDVVTLDGVVVEDTFDWYAQHEDGTVWYMGEIARNYEDGELTDLDGSWEAGEDGALPGIIMLAQPTPGTTYRQELLLTEAEDAGTVAAVGVTADTSMGTYTNCVRTLDFTPLEPDVLESKYYAPGIGLVLEVNEVTGERLELVSFVPGS